MFAKVVKQFRYSPDGRNIVTAMVGQQLEGRAAEIALQAACGHELTAAEFAATPAGQPPVASAPADALESAAEKAFAESAAKQQAEDEALEKEQEAKAPEKEDEAELAFSTAKMKRAPKNKAAQPPENR